MAIPRMKQQCAAGDLVVANVNIKPMNKYVFFLLIFVLNIQSINAQALYTAAPLSTQTKWASAENITGGKGKAAIANKGAKGNPFVTLEAGKKIELLNVQGSGIIHRIWMSGTIPRIAEQRRMIQIDIYWDNAKTPAVSAPIGDFFGVGLGLTTSFENALFANPEGRSFNATIDMPYKKGAKIVLTNLSNSHALIWYDINYSEQSVPANALYFHSIWNRVLQTKLGEDFEILPKINGRGRFIGSNIGVIGDTAYNNTWFGEGEVKIYLDGDSIHPSLSGTGTEDYIGSGWGQGVYDHLYQGSLIANDKFNLYAFYRYHIKDPVYFHRNCKVTLQQIGNTSIANMRAMLARGVHLKPTSVLMKGASADIFNLKGIPPQQYLLLDTPIPNSIYNTIFDSGDMGANFYRSDDVSAVAYFYLDKPERPTKINSNSNLPIIKMQEKVWSFLK